MNELTEPIRIKQLPVFNVYSCINMMQNHLNIANKNGVNVLELNANVFVYDFDDLIFTVEYIKMICNLTTVFRSIYDNCLYTLRLQGYIDDSIYSSINFHQIFNEVNKVFNDIIDDNYLFEEIHIYQSEISLETSLTLYDVFSDNIILALKDFINPKLLKLIFIKNNIKYLNLINGTIMNQLENVFLMY